MIHEAESSRRKLQLRLAKFANGISCIELSIVNAYILVSEDPNGGTLLVDCGLATSEEKIRTAFEEVLGPARQPDAILLTHGHFDHVGTTRSLAAAWDIPVYAHRLEHPYLQGTSKYPPPSPAAGRGVMAWSSIVFPRGPIELGDRLRDLPKDGSVPHLPEWRWIPTPGHSPGHVSL
ncbi:MAG: MBL fold metallo-hydrolase, partial [Candidatus Competibacteraceae bacterium]|nr:MBL fold metallo-hydrolase [Candidatus Competibacteraceae bacterium]